MIFLSFHSILFYSSHIFLTFLASFGYSILTLYLPILEVSDSTGFGSGGTSVAALVTTSSDASCFNSTTQVSPDFVFSIDPANQLVQCEDTRIWWDNSTVQGYAF